MLELIREAIAANQAEASTYSQAVRVWMRVMSVAFLASVVFAPWKAGARWILIAMLINIAGLVFVKVAMPELTRTTIGTTVHLLFWTLALFMIWRPGARETRRDDFSGATGRLYQVWLVLASLIMATSLVLDARTAIGWLV
ncbi:MAG: hypothetical protein JJ931_09925 [Henriciella sp.]|nr:hypothetical protein [Henriciella sp.]MBO6695726.1 hypothetical protein [Henriciella sp.]